MGGFLEQIAVSIAAITGVLAARGKEIDLFGVLVLALVTAFGGGTVCDVLLGNLPVFGMVDQSFILNGAITAVITFYLVRYRELPVNALLVADAFALALFTMVGTRKGMNFSIPPTMAIMMGVITGVAGGILRDLLIGEIPMVFRREVYLYATAAFGGAIMYVCLQSLSVGNDANAIASVLVTLVLRLAGIRWRIRLPMFRPKHFPAPASTTAPKDGQMNS